MRVDFGPNLTHDIRGVLEYVARTSNSQLTQFHEYNRDAGALSTYASSGNYMIHGVVVCIEYGGTHTLNYELIQEVHGYFEGTENDIINLLEKSQQYIENRLDDKIKIFNFCSGSSWSIDGFVNRRELSTIHLPLNIISAFQKDLKTFLKPETVKWYQELNVPHTRIYMLHGPPGTGKTSLIQCAATLLDMNLATFIVSNKTDDEDFKKALKRLPKRTIMCIEDIDCMFANRTTKNSQLTFSGVINALDGISRLKDGLIIFITTNHIEQIDSALRRRIDYSIKFDYCSRQQIRDIFKRFRPDELGFEDVCAKFKLTPNILQKFLLKKLPIEDLALEFDETDTSHSLYT